MLLLKLLGGIIFPVVFFGALLFLPAGTLHWWHAWVFLGVVLICTTVSMVAVFAKDESLLDERYKSPIQEGQPLADKIVINLLVVTFTAVVVFIPLDVFRFHVMPGPSAALSLAGLLAFIAGWTLIVMAFRENSFAAPVVKHQEERHQFVVSTGVYRFVRHPMYSSLVLLLPGMALWLGSNIAALLAIVPILSVMLRIVFEERFLKRELPGYDAYTHKVRYRMIPFVW